MATATLVKRYEEVPTERLRAWQRELQQPSDRSTFRSRVEEIHAQIRGKTFFNQPGVQFLRDAWIASRVATGLSAGQVRLWPGNQPDFEVVVGAKALLFEATEADKPGRKRGDEYLQSEEEARPDPVSEWRQRFEMIPKALEKAISKKVKKHTLYPPGTNLIVLINLGCYRVSLSEGVPLLYQHTSAAKRVFRGVYALWEGYLFHCWGGGERKSAFWSTRDEELPDETWSKVQESIWREVTS
jgi:hypothetical protein